MGAGRQKKAGWTSHEGQGYKQCCSCTSCFSSCLWFLPWVPVLAPQRWTVSCEGKLTLSSPSPFWSVSIHSSRRLTRTKPTEELAASSNKLSSLVGSYRCCFLISDKISHRSNLRKEGLIWGQEEHPIIMGKAWQRRHNRIPCDGSLWPGFCTSQQTRDSDSDVKQSITFKAQPHHPTSPARSETFKKLPPLPKKMVLPAGNKVFCVHPVEATTLVF